MGIETTIVVSFNSSNANSAAVLAELDDVLNVDSDGKVVTSFGLDGEPYFRFNAPTNIRLDSVETHHGGILDHGTETRTLEVEQLFASRNKDTLDTLTLSVAHDQVSVDYVGNAGRYTTAVTNGIATFTGDADYTPFLLSASVEYTARIFQLIPGELDLGDDETLNIYVTFYVSEV